MNVVCFKKIYFNQYQLTCCKKYVCIECYYQVNKIHCPFCRYEQFRIVYTELELTLSVHDLYKFLNKLEITKLTALQFLIANLTRLGQEILLVGGKTSIPYVNIEFSNLTHQTHHIFDPEQLIDYDLSNIDSIVVINKKINIQHIYKFMYVWHFS